MRVAILVHDVGHCVNEMIKLIGSNNALSPHVISAPSVVHRRLNG
jgi:hypothetical protein